MPHGPTEHSEYNWLERHPLPRNHAPASMSPGRCSALNHYNLNEASRIRSMVSDPTGPLKCPTCGGVLSGLAGGHGDRAVLLLRCGGCGRGLVLPKWE